MVLPIIQALWIGESLSSIEQLCISSFLKNGHEFHLYTYDRVGNIPEGTTIKNGNDILDSSKIVRYKNGSVSLFTNWFRFEILKKFGGFWVDLDVICLKPFNFSDNEPVFSLEVEGRICTAVMSFPKNHKFTNFMIDINKNPNKFLPYDNWKTKKRKLKRKLKGQGLEQTNWGETSGPTGVSNGLKYFDMLKSAKHKDYFFPIHYMDWKFIYYSSTKIDDSVFKNTYAIHLWNEMSRREEGFDKNATFKENSLIEQLKKKYL